MSSRCCFTWILIALLSITLLEFPTSAEQRNEVYHLRRSYNYATRKLYPELYSQLSAAPFVHTLPVQLLIDKPQEGRQQPAEYDRKLYEKIMQHALNPPSFPPSEEVLSPSWSLLAWRVSRTMEWAHVLHDQLIDILADDRVIDKKAATQEALDYYLKDPDAITPRPLKVELLSHFPNSHRFHHAYPKVMGIMMSYHWLQGAQYEAMLSPAGSRKQNVSETIAHFRSLLQNPPTHFPLTHKAAPKFYELSPKACAIFDNLHILHHIAQDILIAEQIKDKRQTLYRVLPLFLNSTASTEWFAPGPQEEPLMPGAVGHIQHQH